MLPTVAMAGACRRLVMLSLTRPSPNTFTVKGLPVHTQKHTRTRVTLQLSVYWTGSDLCSRAWDVLVCELDVDDVTSWFRRAISHPAGAVFNVLTVDVDLTGTFDAEAKATITWATNMNVLDLITVAT